jgi:hypothetical protein
MRKSIAMAGVVAVLAGRLLAATGVDVSADGRRTIDWGRGTIKAVGTALPREGMEPAAAKAWQRMMAVLDAYRELLEAVQSVRVTPESIKWLDKLMKSNPAANVDGVLDGARVVEEGYDADGSTYRVVMQVSAVAEAQGEPARKPGPYTGLIIDARGLGLQRCMSPKVMTADGEVVFGNVMVSTELVQTTGIAGFTPTIEDAAKRAGSNPLVITATARQGTTWANAVVSNADGALILAENAKAKFLEGFRVVFVV